MANLIWDLLLKGAKYEGLWMCSVGVPLQLFVGGPVQLFACYATRTIQTTKDQGLKLEVGNMRKWLFFLKKLATDEVFCNSRDYYQHRRVSDSLTGLVSKKRSGLDQLRIKLYWLWDQIFFFHQLFTFHQSLLWTSNVLPSQIYTLGV